MRFWVIRLAGSAGVVTLLSSPAMAVPPVESYSFAIRIQQAGLDYLNTQLTNVFASNELHAFLNGIVLSGTTYTKTGQPKALVDQCLTLPLINGGNPMCFAAFAEEWQPSWTPGPWTPGTVVTYTVTSMSVQPNPFNPNNPLAYQNDPNGSLIVNVGLSNVEIPVLLGIGTAWSGTTGASPQSYVRARGYAQIPSLTLTLEITVVGGKVGTYAPGGPLPNPYPGAEIGLRLISFNFGAGFHFALVPGTKIGGCGTAGDTWNCSTLPSPCTGADICPGPETVTYCQAALSCLVANLIPYLDIGLTLSAVDKFNSTLEYYFGPSPLLDVASSLGLPMSIAFPLSSGGLISIDLGFYFDFLADALGVALYPGGLGLNLSYNKLSCLNPPPGAGPWVFPIVPYSLDGLTPTGGAYMVGLALHENVFNRILYQAFASGLFCLDIDKDNFGSGAPSGLSQFLNTNTLIIAVPSLYKAYPNRDVRIVVRPALVSPETGGYNLTVDTPSIKPGPYPGASITMTIPHLLVDFYIDTGNVGTWQRAFGVDAALKAGIGLSVAATSTTISAPRDLFITVAPGMKVNLFTPYLEGLSGVSQSLISPLENFLNAIIPAAINSVMKGVGLGITLPTIPGGINYDVPYIGPAGPVDPWTGQGSYLGIYANLVGNLDPNFIVDLLSGSGAISNIFGAPPALNTAAPQTFVVAGGTTAGSIELSPSETKALGFTSQKTVIGFTGIDPSGPGGGLLYTWRIDDGFWHLFSPEKEAVLTYLPDGRHEFEVRAMNTNRVIDPSPALLAFTIDSQPPDVTIDGKKRVSSQKTVFAVAARDNISTPASLRLAWFLDDGAAGHGTMSDGDGKGNCEIVLHDLTPGRHTLFVTAEDEAGNTGQANLSFDVVDGKGLGCSTLPGNSGTLPALWPLVLLAIFLARGGRRRLIFSILFLLVLGSCGRPGENTGRGVFSYETRIVDTGEKLGQYPSLAFKSSGLPAISYYDENNGALKYAELEGTDWMISTVENSTPSTGGVGAFTSLALDSSDSPHISYMDRSTGRLKYAERVGGQWKVQVLDRGPNVGSWTSLKLDKEGRAYIAYCYARYYVPPKPSDPKDPSRVMEAYPKYIMYEGNTIPPPEVIDPLLVGAALSGDTHNLGLTTSIVLTKDGRPEVAYYDPVNGSLNLASRTAGGGWTTSVIDSAPNESIGQFHSLVMDNQGRLHVSYTEMAPLGVTPYPSLLKYAVFDGQGWNKETVDAVKGELNGIENSLALGPDSEPIISYADNTWNDLKLAFFRFGGWQIYRLDTGGLEGIHSSVSVSPQGLIGVAYYEDTAATTMARWALKFSLVEY